MMKEPIAVASSDWHWWHNAPACRSGEEDWMKTMGGYVQQIVWFAKKNRIPVIMGGDVFDRFNPPPEAVNRLYKALNGETIIAVPGQHDLENHLIENLGNTGFQTLMSMNAIEYNSENPFPLVSDYTADVYCVPWNGDIGKVVINEGSDYKILVCHKYVWKDKQTRFPGDEPLEEGKLVGGKLAEELQKFDFAIFGDNHIPFTSKVGNCQVINCGTLARRKLSELEYVPSFWVLYTDGTVERKEINTENDIVDLGVYRRKEGTESEFIKELSEDSDSDFDFVGRIRTATAKNTDQKNMFEEIFKKYEGAL